MSEFAVPVVRIESIEKHPNADRLSITQIEGCPVIFITEQFKVGDLAIYIPVESVVPLDRPYFSFLSDKEGKKTYRVKARKIRGIFSMGFLVKPKDVYGCRECVESPDVASDLGVVKYVEPERTSTYGRRESGGNVVGGPIYDVAQWRKYRQVLENDTPVVITEKIHGCNGRFAFVQRENDDLPRLYCGSHNYWVKDSESSVWWKAARKYNLEEVLKRHPNLILYGEVYGNVQDIKYDATPTDPVRFAAFDIFDLEKGRFWDWQSFEDFCNDNGIPIVPVLSYGIYGETDVEKLAQGNSTLANCIREGVVVRPMIEMWDRRCGRVILKCKSEAYMLRKNGTEYQ